MGTTSTGDGGKHLEKIPEGCHSLLNVVVFSNPIMGGSHGEATADPPPFHHLPSRPQIEVQAAVSGQI